MKLRFFTLLMLYFSMVSAQDSAIITLKKYKIVKFTIHEEIAPAATRRTMKAFELADKVGADLILLDLDTYGGLVSDADSIRTRILNSRIPVYVFIQNNAASAGAFISISCNKIFMRRGATIGAATVVNQEGEKVPDKYQSYMRSKMRSTAEARGRNPDIAQAMVDGDIVVDSVNEKGKVVTLTASEAIKHGFCDGEAETIEEALKKSGINDYEIIETKLTFIDKAMGFLMNPAISGILVLLIFGGIYYELQQPGIGFPLVLAICAAALYFAPLYLDGLAANWEILLFIIGIGLLILEIFVTPGFGIAGTIGLVVVFLALVLSLVRNVDFDFSLTTDSDLMFAFLRVVLSFVGFIIFMILFGRGFMESRYFKRMVLHTDLGDARVGIPHTRAEEMNVMTGMKGTCYTDLKPQGRVRIEGILYNATSLGEFIERDTEITVLKENNGVLLVRSTLKS